MSATGYFFRILLAAQCILLACGSIAELYSCPSLHFCSCGNGRIDCICPKGDEKLDLTVIFDTDVRVIRVHNCGNVTVPYYMASNLQLEEMSFTNLALLHIHSLAFAGTSRIDYLQMRNIADLVLDKYALFGLTNASAIELRNVSIDSIASTTIAGYANVEEVVIRDSNVGSVESFAFHLANQSIFRMINTRVEYLQNASFYAGDVALLEFYNDTFVYTDDGSFALTHVGVFNVTGCHFAHVHSEMVVGNDVREFVFDGNHVEMIGEHAFWNLVATSSVHIADNKFSSTERDSLALSVTGSPGVRITFSNNSFSCDCQLFWLWEKMGYHKYSGVFNSGYCFGPEELQGAALVNVTPVFVEEMQACTGLVLSDASTAATTGKPIRVHKHSVKGGMSASTISKAWQDKAASGYCLLALASLLYCWCIV